MLIHIDNMFTNKTLFELFSCTTEILNYQKQNAVQEIEK